MFAAKCAPEALCHEAQQRRSRVRLVLVPTVSDDLESAIHRHQTVVKRWETPAFGRLAVPLVCQYASQVPS